MANPIKGEVSFESGKQSYKLSFSTNALCELEQALDMSVSEISNVMRDPEKFRMTMARTVFWAGLQDHHPGIDIDAVSEMLSHQKAPVTISLISRAFELAFPDDVEEGASRPQQTAQVGNGEASLRRGKALASTQTTFGGEHPVK